jgi:hypothetical protein
MNYFYVATCYTQHPKGQQAAFEDACMITATLMKMGLKVFSPISHSHPIADTGDIDKLDWGFWKEQCQPMIDQACGIIVARMPGWEQSVGITYEIGEFEKAGKMILYFDP